MKLGVKDVAMLMGKSEQYVRIGLQMRVLPFGEAVLLPSGNYRYYISSELFEKYTGIKIGDNKDWLKNKKLAKRNDFDNSSDDEFLHLKNKLISNLSENVGELNKFQCEIELLKYIIIYELDNKKKQEIKCHN